MCYTNTYIFMCALSVSLNLGLKANPPPKTVLIHDVTTSTDNGEAVVVV